MKKIKLIFKGYTTSGGFGDVCKNIVANDFVMDDIVGMFGDMADISVVVDFHDDNFLDTYEGERGGQ